MISYSKHGLFSPLLLCHLRGRSRWKRVSRLKNRWKAEWDSFRWDSFRWCECDRKKSAKEETRSGLRAGLHACFPFKSWCVWGQVPLTCLKTLEGLRYLEEGAKGYHTPFVPLGTIKNKCPSQARRVGTVQSEDNFKTAHAECWIPFVPFSGP